MPYGKRKVFTEVDEAKVIGIGKRVKIVREYRGLTLEEFGKKLGCTKQFVNQFESKQCMSIGTLVAVCRVLEVTPNTLLGYDTKLEKFLDEVEKAKAKFFAEQGVNHEQG